MQTLLRDPAAGIMHSLIYFSFLILFAVTTVLEINHQLPESPSSSTATCTGPTPPSATRAGLMLLIGVVWAIVRRYVQRPYRIRIKSKPEHARDPRHAPRHRRHRLRGRGVADRPRRAGPTSRSGRSSATRCRG